MSMCVNFVLVWEILNYWGGSVIFYINKKLFIMLFCRILIIGIFRI
jgi:hypothetical protein